MGIVGRMGRVGKREHHLTATPQRNMMLALAPVPIVSLVPLVQK